MRRKRERVNCWWMSFVCLSFVFTFQIEFSECCVWLQCLAQWCCSSFSNAVDCDWKNKEKSKLIMVFFCVPSFFCLHISDWVLWVLCLISMPHSMMLPLCLGYGSLLMRWEMKRVNCWWYVFCVSSFFVFTSQIEFRECCVWFQWFTQWCCSSFSNTVACLCDEKGKEWIADWCLLCVFFLLSLRLRESAMSVVFDFNDSLNDVAPLSPILLPFYAKRKEKSDLLIDVFCVSSFSCIHISNRDLWVLCLI